MQVKYKAQEKKIEIQAKAKDRIMKKEAEERRMENRNINNDP